MMLRAALAAAGLGAASPAFAPPALIHPVASPMPSHPTTGVLVAAANMLLSATSPVAPVAVPAALPAVEPPPVPRLRAIGRAGVKAASPPETELVTAHEQLVIERGKGLVVRLPHAAASIFVAEPATADFQARSTGQLYVFGKAPGETVLYAVDGANRVIYAANIRVIQNLSGARAALATHLPGEPVGIAALGATLVLEGSVSTAAAAADALVIAGQFTDAKDGIVNRLSVRAPDQVNLRVRIAEVNRGVLKQFGVNWEALVNSGRFGLDAGTQNPVTFADTFNRNIARLTFGDVTATIDALAQDGLITLLAQPNLTATSGQTASFLAGGEFPVPVGLSNGDGNPTITVEFKKFGISLEFTPTVLDAGRISMRVRPEVSQLTTQGAVQLQGFSIPALTVRRAETTIELGSGETFVIAGLLQRTSEQSLSKIPGLGDLPVLGALFRSTRYRRNETELAIIVTPYLVRPAATAQAVLAPTDGLVEPNDARRVLGGELYRRYPAGSPAAPAQERP